MARTTVTVPTRGGDRVTVDAWPIGGTGVAVTRATEGRGYAITHTASGMRMPGPEWRTIRAARDAWSRLEGMVPGVAGLVPAMADRTIGAGDLERVRAAWRVVLGITPAHRGTFGEALAALLPDGWSGDVDVLVCPCGFTVEHDGRCPSGCVSPLITAGVV